MASASGRHNKMDTDDDFLEAIFMNENRCQDEGFLEGQADGRRKGLQEGFHLGCQKGCEIGTEIGFYLGFSQTIKLNQLDSSKNKDRVLKAVTNLNKLIESFPLTEAQHPSLQEQIQAVRAKFKQRGYPGNRGSLPMTVNPFAHRRVSTYHGCR